MNAVLHPVSSATAAIVRTRSDTHRPLFLVSRVVNWEKRDSIAGFPRDDDTRYLLRRGLRRMVWVFCGQWGVRRVLIRRQVDCNLAVIRLETAERGWKVRFRRVAGIFSYLDRRDAPCPTFFLFEHLMSS